MFGQTADSLAAKQPSPAPEPASLILMVVGAGILARKR